MTLKKTVDGVEYIYSAYMEKMIPRYVWAHSFEEGCDKWEWCEDDLLYYNDCENYMYYDEALEVGTLTEKEFREADKKLISAIETLNATGKF